MSALATSPAALPATLPATPPGMLDKIAQLERFQLAQGDAAELVTEHVLHAGLYARTILMPEGLVLTGARMKRSTLVIVTGACAVLAGEAWIELDGYNVLPASAGRKQVFVSRSPVLITTVFPTSAATVEEAEAEFTDEAAELMSRRQTSNRVVITGE